MSIWVGAGSVASWAVDSVIGSAPDGSAVLKMTYKPPLSQNGNLLTVEELPELPADVKISTLTGFYYLDSPSSIGITILQFDPATDTIFRPSQGGNGAVRNKVINDFVSSSSYTVLRWPYVTKGAVDPDLEGVQEKITGGMLPMLLLLLGCGIGLKLLDYGSIKLMRLWDDKDSQRALARINNIEDPLEHKVALEAHRKAYNARFKRYAKEDRQRRRR